MAKKLKQEKYLNQEVKNQNSVKIKAPIVEALKTAYENPTYQFHIPGHTKGKAIFKDFRKLIGEKAKVIELKNTGTIRRRLLDIGLTPGVIIECILFSPFNDPVAYKIRNATIALRKEGSRLVKIEVIDT